MPGERAEGVSVTGAGLVMCNGREPRGREVLTGAKESGRAMEEDELSRDPEGVCEPASPPIASPRKDLPDAPFPPPCSTHPAWPQGVNCTTKKFIPMLKVQSSLPA